MPGVNKRTKDSPGGGELDSVENNIGSIPPPGHPKLTRLIPRAVPGVNKIYGLRPIILIGKKRIIIFELCQAESNLCRNQRSVLSVGLKYSSALGEVLSSLFTLHFSLYETV